MILVVVISLILSFGILFFTRVYLTKRKLNRGDTFFHLLVSESIRKRRWKYPLSLKNLVFVEIDKNYNYLAYPPLFHYIIALFPTKLHLRVAKNFSLITLSFLGSFAAIITYSLTFDLGFAVLSSFITIFNYAVFDLVTQSTPRTLGLFLYSLVGYLAIFHPETPFSLLMIAFLVSLLGLAHKFSLQALLFGFSLYAFVFNEPYLLLSFMLGLLLSILVSRGFYLKILKEHFSWLHFYRSRPDRAPLLTKLTTIFGKNFWILQITISLLFVLFQSNFSLSWGFLGNDLVAKVAFWAFVNILIALLVSVPALSFLGEYYRYVEYSVIPIGVITSLSLASLSPIISIASFACVFLTIMALNRFRKYLYNSKVLLDKDDVLSYHSLRESGVNNLIVLPGNRSLEVSYYTRLNVIHFVRGPKTPTEHINDLLSNYNVRHVLKFKDDDRYRLFSTMAHLTNMEKIADFKNFELYKIHGRKD